MPTFQTQITNSEKDMSHLQMKSANEGAVFDIKGKCYKIRISLNLSLSSVATNRALTSLTKVSMNILIAHKR